MKRYILFFVSTFAVLMGTHLLLFWLQLGVPTESSRWVDETFELKESLANSIGERKILVVSGSNTLFSLNTQELEARLGVPVVNCGVHAGLKLEYILDRFSKLVEQDDLIVLPLEYSMYGYNGETSQVLSDYLASRDPKYLQNDFGKLFNTAYSFSLLDLWRRNVKRFFPDTPKIGYYDVTYLNSNGDKTNILKSLMTEKDKENLRAYRAIGLQFDSKGEAATLIRNFIECCKNAGGHVLLTFPTTIRFDSYQSEEFLGQISEIQQFVEQSGGRVIGKPGDFFHSTEYFFNSNYHANEDGRRLSTDRLEELLKQYLTNTSKDR